jgi:hypothetical protein
MENKMINVEVLEGSLILSPLQNPKECELLFETWLKVMLSKFPVNELKERQSYLKNTQKNLAEQWAESIINSEEGQKLKDKMDKDFKNKIVLGIPQENIIDLGDSLFCQSIWDKPIKKSTSIKLGLYFSDIPVEQIPFDHTILNNDYDFIKNDYNETLFYQNGVYRLFTNDPTIYLENWFCKWEKSEIEKESGDIEQPQQDPVARLMELGYTEGKIFHRKSCDNYNCGYGIFTGEFGKNCDGITLKFTDGREFLSDFCTLIKDNNPQVMWDITKELQRLQNHYEDNITKFKQQYLNLK